MRPGAHRAGDAECEGLHTAGALGRGQQLLLARRRIVGEGDGASAVAQLVHALLTLQLTGLGIVRVPARLLP